MPETQNAANTETRPTDVEPSPHKQLQNPSTALPQASPRGPPRPRNSATQPNPLNPNPPRPPASAPTPDPKEAQPRAQSPARHPKLERSLAPRRHTELERSASNRREVGIQLAGGEPSKNREVPTDAPIVAIQETRIVAFPCFRNSAFTYLQKHSNPYRPRN
jgi:hypothetical protein